MTRFIDGPAKGQKLMLKRAAFFMRVVEENGKWDALDQPGDSPRPGEKLYAYKVQGEVGMCHINMGSKGGGFYPMAEYRMVDPQPSDAEMREYSAWVAWCERQPGAKEFAERKANR